MAEAKDKKVKIKVKQSVDAENHLNNLTTNLKSQVTEVATRVAKAQQKTNPTEVNADHIEDAYYSIVKGRVRGCWHRWLKLLVSLVSGIGLFMIFIGLRNLVPTDYIPLCIFGGFITTISAHMVDALALDN